MPDRDGFELPSAWKPLVWHFPCNTQVANNHAARRAHLAECGKRPANGKLEVERATTRTERRHATSLWAKSHAPRLCAYPACANEFEPRRVGRRYCSATCRKRAERERRRAE